MLAASFATLINQKVLVPSTRTQYVAVDRSHLIDILKPTLRRIRIDPDWYLSNNPDIAEAIDSGIFSSAEEHYVTCGYYEHRIPYKISVDENWYLTQYPDVKEAVDMGHFSSATDHFYVAGFQEGRIPHAGFSFQSID